MRGVGVTMRVAAVVTVAGLLALNWRAQLRTQEKLDALAAAATAAPQPTPPAAPATESRSVPRELSNVKLPPYVVEAPDVLTIEAVLKDPKTGTVDRLPTQPISGSFQVRPDGSVHLGFWGSVPVAGLTLDQASAAIRSHLAKSKAAEMTAENLAVTVDVTAYNSKRYYVIFDGVGFGAQQVQSFPLTGSETVLDALANVAGLPEAARTKTVYVARKAPAGGQQVLPVDWKGITREGVTATNYQLLSGDRVYVTRAGGGPKSVPPELD